MEPEVRYQLHDDVQLQLSSSPNYLIRYTLHTPKGPLGLLEIGEAYKQHNRHLLRGYFMIVDEQVIESEQPVDSDLETRNSDCRLPRSSISEPSVTSSHTLSGCARSRI